MSCTQLFSFSSLHSFENTPTSSPAVKVAPQTITQMGCSLINPEIPVLKDPRRTFITAWSYVHVGRRAHEHILSLKKLSSHYSYMLQGFSLTLAIYLFLQLEPLEPKAISHPHFTL